MEWKGTVSVERCGTRVPLGTSGKEVNTRVSIELEYLINKLLPKLGSPPWFSPEYGFYKRGKAHKVSVGNLSPEVYHRLI